MRELRLSWRSFSDSLIARREGVLPPLPSRQIFALWFRDEPVTGGNSTARIFALLVVAACGLIAWKSLPSPPPQAAAGSNEIAGFVKSKSSSSISLSVANCSPAAPEIRIAVNGTNLQAALNNYGLCDRVIAGVAPQTSDTVTSYTLTSLRPRAATLSGRRRAALLALNAALLLALTWFFAGDVRKLLFIGQDNRYSGSTTQISLWFLLTLTAYITAFAVKASDGVFGLNIPTNLLMLSGFSAISFTGAKGITNKKHNDAVAAHAARTKTPAGTPRFPQDYVQNDDNQFDFGDYQMILITIIAFVSYLLHVYQFLAGVELRAAASLPDVDTPILGLFGVGHGAYLVKKSVSDIKS